MNEIAHIYVELVCQEQQVCCLSYHYTATGDHEEAHHFHVRSARPVTDSPTSVTVDTEAELATLFNHVIYTVEREYSNWFIYCDDCVALNHLLTHYGYPDMDHMRNGTSRYRSSPHHSCPNLPHNSIPI